MGSGSTESSCFHRLYSVWCRSLKWPRLFTFNSCLIHRFKDSTSDRYTMHSASGRPFEPSSSTSKVSHVVKMSFQQTASVQNQSRYSSFCPGTWDDDGICKMFTILLFLLNLFSSTNSTVGFIDSFSLNMENNANVLVEN